MLKNWLTKYKCKGGCEEYKWPEYLLDGLCQTCRPRPEKVSRLSKSAANPPVIPGKDGPLQVIPGINVPLPGETWEDLNDWRGRYGMKPKSAPVNEAS